VLVVWNDDRQMTVGISVAPGVNPTGFQLHPNYPNPFNPVTHLSFELPRSGFVELTIYDVLG
jgi:hypothetical protein